MTIMPLNRLLDLVERFVVAFELFARKYDSPMIQFPPVRDITENKPAYFPPLEVTFNPPNQCIPMPAYPDWMKQWGTWQAGGGKAPLSHGTVITNCKIATPE